MLTPVLALPAACFLGTVWQAGEALHDAWPTRPDSETDRTRIRRTPSGQTEALSREGNNLQLQTLSPREAGGQGMRLGVAYELDDGEVLSVPDGFPARSTFITIFRREDGNRPRRPPIKKERAACGDGGESAGGRSVPTCPFA